MQCVSRDVFPKDFVWGVATSAFQIEGASNVDGKGPSIWDEFCRLPGAIQDTSNGNVACDHYHLWESDLNLIAELGVGAYRFSVSWPRVQALGCGAFNEAGFAFYDRLVDGMLARGLKPFLTLNHWDLPAALQNAGGWNNRDIVHRFVDYALEVERRLGSRVSSICTHNEPWVMAVLGHQTGVFAPGIKSRAVAMQVVHHLLLSHGLAIRALRAQGATCELGIVLNLSPVEPATESPEDASKATQEDGINLRWYLDPLFKGAYPEDVIDHLGDDMPTILAGDLAAISAPMDFLGVNYYMRSVVSADPTWQHPIDEAVKTDMGWEIYPKGLTDLLLRLNRDYTMPPIFITENGAAFKDALENGHVNDIRRQAYIESHIFALHEAIQQGVKVGGYFVWSLLDNFEWASGYAKRFGIVHVDYVTQKRTLKASGQWFRRYLRAKAET